MPDEAFAARPDEAVQVFNFRFAREMVPGWTLARARVVDTGQKVRMVQANASAEGAVARIEILETEGPERGRKLFMETLTRFQRNPATILRTPPRIGEAEACLGESVFTFLRGNLVVTVAAMGPASPRIEELARQLDRVICEKPDVPDEPGDPPAMRSASADTSASHAMVKVFTRSDATSERFAVEPDGRARRFRDKGNEDPGDGD